MGWALAGELDNCFNVLCQPEVLPRQQASPRRQRRIYNKGVPRSKVGTHQALAPRRQHPQQHDPQGKPGDVEQPGEHLDEGVNPHREPARDEAQEDRPQREQDDKSDGRHDPVGGAAPHGRVVVEARPEPEPKAVAVAISVTAAAVARVPTAAAAAGTPSVPAPSSPAAELGECRMGERGW